MTETVHLDGSYGEGGGQILRTALSLSAVTGRPLHITNVRGRRPQPGLRPQHLAGLRALAAVCDAEVTGDDVGSREVTFAPRRRPRAGVYDWDVQALSGVGSAGSIGLFFQTIYVPLALAGGPTTLTLSGGTHVRWSPTFHYLDEVFLPTLAPCGYRADLTLERWGWYPRGGGRVTVRIQGAGAAANLRPLTLLERGRLRGVRGFSAISNLPAHIAQRQRDQVLARLRARHLEGEIEIIDAPSIGPGTAVFLRAEAEHAVAGFTGFGRLRYPAERVADDAADGLDAYLSSHAAVDEHLGDQLLLPLALVPGESAYTAASVTSHLLTNAWAIQHFLDRQIVVTGAEGEPGEVRIV